MYVMCIMLYKCDLSLQVAKWVGDIFTAGIYDINIQLKKIPYMEWDSPEHMDRSVVHVVHVYSFQSLDLKLHVK